MLFEVKLPHLGEDDEEKATVLFWLVEEDAEVEEEEDLLELQTDKAAFTLPSPKAGKLVEYLVREDEEVGVGDVLGLLEI